MSLVVRPLQAGPSTAAAGAEQLDVVGTPEINQGLWARLGDRSVRVTPSAQVNAGRALRTGRGRAEDPQGPLLRERLPSALLCPHLNQL